MTDTLQGRTRPMDKYIRRSGKTPDVASVMDQPNGDSAGFNKYTSHN